MAWENVMVSASNKVLIRLTSNLLYGFIVSYLSICVMTGRYVQVLSYVVFVCVFQYYYLEKPGVGKIPQEPLQMS